MATFHAAALLVAVVLTAAAAVRWPVATWAVSLACFGLPHVLVELRWVDQRYSRSLDPTSWMLLGAPLAGVVVLRTLTAGGALPPGAWSLVAELSLVGTMLAAAVWLADGARPGPRVAALAAALAFGAGVVWAPLDTALVLAILHNVTPAGFLADRLGRDPDLSGPWRRAGVPVTAAVFAGIPLLLASGAVDSWLGATTATAPDVLGAGLEREFAAVAPSFVPAHRTLDLMRAVAFLQCMHYLAVLVVLPMLGATTDPARRPRLHWPAPGTFALAVTGLGAVTTLGFVVDFHGAKAGYGILAAVHAWIELPTLLLALSVTTAGPHRRRRLPARWTPAT